MENSPLCNTLTSGLKSLFERDFNSSEFPISKFSFR
eukprot:02267.XXX_23344_23451_1 [CDS] Oithona nana genome sequencing.